jgi:hypothetical protein
LCGLGDLPVSRRQLPVQLLAERCQPDGTGGSVEQWRADEPFLLLDRLADPGRGEAQPVSGAAEVPGSAPLRPSVPQDWQQPQEWFLGQGQEDLDVTKPPDDYQPGLNNALPRLC